MDYCGMDVAKRKHAIALLDEKGHLVQPSFTIENTRAGFDQLLQAVQDWDGPVLIGLEATGHYWWALYDELTRHDYPVSCWPLCRTGAVADHPLAGREPGLAMRQVRSRALLARRRCRHAARWLVDQPATGVRQQRGVALVILRYCFLV
jgi:hypothetical protein